MSGVLKSIGRAPKVKKQPGLPAGEPVEPGAPEVNKPIVMPSLTSPALLQEARKRATMRGRRGRRGTVLSSAAAYSNRTLGGTS